MRSPWETERTSTSSRSERKRDKAGQPYLLHPLRLMLRHLSSKLRGPPAAGWPVPPPDVPLEELQRIHALIEAEFSQVDAKG